ncbi:MAG TPA: sigma-54-dependent Fis family transcriptional regulator, partial [Polyangiaceae bacterium LLY-WYZ-15_(1-7)]|nr:sigma-54-dependent Fis family transcriptional regulator [Polyangiaceae bacterium LLY-WYZ-15_(1-7)]
RAPHRSGDPGALPRLPLRVHCPGLGERREDVPRLAQTLLAAATEDDPALRERFAEPDGGFRLAPELVEALALHGYRQHVRELHGLLWQSFQSSLGGRLELTSEVRAALDVAPPPPTVAPEELGREDIVAALEAHDGVVSRAYAALGLRSRHQLHRLMKKHGL